MGGPIKIAVMWRGDWRTPNAPTRYDERLQPVLQALRAAHFRPEPIRFCEEQTHAVREALAGCAGALVWINPLADGRDRSVVDALLREFSRRGGWISAHPNVIEKMGVKDVLYATRALGWGSDTERYTSLDDFRMRFCEKLKSGPRVLKPHRGNDGKGVLKVSGGLEGLRVQFASDDRTDEMSPADLITLVAPAFENSGRLIDQEFHPADRGMVRCYLSFDRVIGFARQEPRASGGRRAFAMNSAKQMFPSDELAFAGLRESMHKDWIPGMKRILQLETHALPALWDADFLLRGHSSRARSAYALCEVNASCVSPFPDVAPIEIAQGVRRWVIG